MVSRRQQRLAWCLFDFANSAFNTVVVTFVYATYFATTLVGGKERGDAAWADMMSVSGLAIAVLAPFAGAHADRSAHKRRWLVGTSLVVVACSAALVLPAPDPALGRGSASSVWSALLLVGLANVAFELMFVFYNAFLPQLATPTDMGRLSGRGWAFGYVGGLACLALCLGFVGFGSVGPWVTREGALNVRVTALVVAFWFLVFGLPMFLLVRDERASPRETLPPSAAPRSVLATVRSLPQRPDLLRFLLAHLVYNDALMGLINLAGLYMAITLGMSTGEIMVTAIGLNVLAGIGALGFGGLDDRLGPRPVILLSLVLLVGGSVLAIAVPTKQAFWVAASLVGVGMGPNQSASRTLLARLAEGGRSAEYFGLFALSGKATVWLAPFLFARVVEATESQRLGLLPLLLMFAIGFVLMLGVRHDGKR
ncbi:MAG: MFS transporter [Planctomycetota bacterium]